jgi:CelD/BcsL family acetyltransferase involved in cellulose biosynthesis
MVGGLRERIPAGRQDPIRRGAATVLPRLAAHGSRLTATANYHSPVFTPATEDEAVAQELLRAAFARSESEVLLYPLPEALLPLVRRAAGTRRLHVEAVHTSPIVETTGELELYSRELSTTLRRRRRKLEREHEVRLWLADGDADLSGALTRGFAIEGSGWKGRNGTAILSRPQTVEFYTRIANAYRSRGELVLGTLTVDGCDVAWHMTLRRGQRLYMLKTGYVEEAARLAPGLVLHLLTIENCFADPGVHAYELLGDSERWKREFATAERRHVRVSATTHGPLGTAFWSARHHGLPLARKLRNRSSARRRPAGLAPGELQN